LPLYHELAHGDILCTPRNKLYTSEEILVMDRKIESRKGMHMVVAFRIERIKYIIKKLYTLHTRTEGRTQRVNNDLGIKFPSGG
jgi:hypothetical protein